MAREGLDQNQQRAAALVGLGWQKKAVARELGLSDRTISRWSGEVDFRDLVQRQRAAILAAKPTAKATLEAALVAVTPSGAPDWRTRVSAARALTGLDDHVPTELGETSVRETTIYTEALEDGDAG